MGSHEEALFLDEIKPNRCPGCGTPFQKDAPESPGFLPPSAEGKEGAVCRRCFRLIHYGQVEKASLNDGSLIASLKPVAREATGTVLLVDPTALEFSRRALVLAQDLQLPFIAVITKADLFSRWMTPEALSRWVSSEWDLSPKRTIALSLFDRKALFSLRSRLPKLFGKGYRLLIMGATNSGKSTFIGGISRQATAPAVFPLPGTTLDFISIDMGDEGVLIDSPGLSLGNFWISRLCPQCLARLVPNHKLSRKTFILHPDQSLMFGGLAYARIRSCGDKEWVKLTAFTSSEVTLHRTKAGREADLSEQHAGTMLSVPCSSCLATLKGSYPFQETVLSLEKGEDLVIPGCGWLSCCQGEATFSLLLPKGLMPERRRWLVEPFPIRRNSRRR